jgi:hypothetical protein
MSFEGPFGPQAAVMIEDAYMGALATHAKFLRGTNREGDHLTAAGTLSLFGGCRSTYRSRLQHNIEN